MIWEFYSLAPRVPRLLYRRNIPCLGIFGTIKECDKFCPPSTMRSTFAVLQFTTSCSTPVPGGFWGRVVDSHLFLCGVALHVHSPFYNFPCNCSKSSDIFEKLEVKEITELLLPSSLLLHYLMICTDLVSWGWLSKPPQPSLISCSPNAEESTVASSENCVLFNFP